jgi:AraC-like DNA-binding protein
VGFVRWFQPSAPSPDLRDVLACVWSAAARGRHQLIPDGSLELLWIDGGGTWLCGPDTHSWAFHLPHGTAISGVRFRPGAAADVLGLDAHEVRDARVALSDLLGSRTGRILGERLSHAAGPARRTSVLEDVVRARRNDLGPGSTVELAALVGTDPKFGVEHLAAETGVSPRQLRRRFDRDVGYGPAFFARVARLQRFSRAAARSPGRGIAELAAQAGYVDQPHLAKDCRALAAMTPRELVDVLPDTSIAARLDHVEPRVRSVQDELGVHERRSAA